MWCDVVKEILAMLNSASYQCPHMKYVEGGHILTHLIGCVFIGVLKSLAGCNLSHSKSSYDAP
jgi:hypothetical protein